MESHSSQIDRVDRALIIEAVSPRTNGNPSSTSPAGASLFQGSVSLINILLGIGILSMPYAMSGAGAAGLLSVWLCCWLFCKTGKYIHWGLDRIPDEKPHDYPGLGEAALGVLGRRLVSIAAAAELFGASCMCLIIMWRSTEQVAAQALDGFDVSPSTIHVAALASGTAVQLLLCIFGTYPTLSGISALGCVSTASVMLLIAILPILDPHKKWLQEAPTHHAISIDIIPATSILALGVAGHSAFPSVRSSMADKRQFPVALNIAYAACAIATGTVCAVGYWYWGDAAHVLVTTDFEAHSPYAAYTLRGFGIQHAVELLVAVNVGTKTPLYVIALQEIVSASVDPAVQQRDAEILPSALYTLRFAIIALVIAVSLGTQHVLGSVESVSGAVSVIASSLLLPTIFAAALRRKGGLMGPASWAVVAAFVTFGAGLMAVVLTQTALKIVAWLEGETAPDAAWLEGAKGDGGFAGVLGAGASGVLEL